MDVEAWLRDLGLEQYAEAFADNHINAATLGSLTSEDLKEIGVISVGHRRQLLNAIACVDEKPETAFDANEISIARTTPEAERRQLTIMFCDLVGSTQLAERLDPEDLRALLTSYQDVCKAAIERYDGYVARYLGDGVLAYFGYPTAHEDDAERAVRAGLSIVEKVQRLDSPVGGPNGREALVRVGIATGPVVVGDLIGEGASLESAVVGETPNLAARLQGLAEPNTVVVSVSTHRLTTGHFRYQDLGVHPLKGISAPVRVWGVVGERSVESRFEATHAGQLASLVGREHELALLHERWRLAKGGEGQVVLLSGEAGIGKSRIVRALRELVSEDRHYSLRYQCLPFHASSAFYPIIQRLERAARYAAEDTVDVKLDKLEELLRMSSDDIDTIAPLFAALLSLPADHRYGPLDLTPQQRRDRIFAAMMGQVLALSEQRPVLFVVEDVQWIDPTTQHFAGELMVRVRDAAVLMLITHRPEYLPPWSALPHQTSLALNRLSRDQAAEIVRTIPGGQLSDGVVDRIIARADGVPLFIEELTKNVLESESTGVDLIATDRIPTTLRASLTARLDRLDEAKEIAQIGAAIGREYSYEVIGAVAQKTRVELDVALDRLVQSELVFRTVTSQGTVYTFKHALVQEVAYETMLKSRRVQLHRHIAQVLEADFPGIAQSEPEILARHYTEANMILPAIACWQRAGQHAVEVSANPEAVSHYEKALELLAALPETRERDELELELRVASGGPLFMTKGQTSPEVDSTFSRARELFQRVGDRNQLVETLFSLWRRYTHRPDYGAQRDLAAQLVEIGDSADDTVAKVLGHYSLGYTLFGCGEIEESRTHLEQAYGFYDPALRESLAFRLGQDPGVACLANLAIALWVLGYPDAGAKRAHDAISLAEELSHPFSHMYALGFSCLVHQLRRDAAAVRRNSALAISLAREQGFSAWLYSRAICEGWARSQEGEVTEGIQEIHEGLEITRGAVHRTRLPYFLSLLAEANLLAGRTNDARSLINNALDIVAEIDEHWFEAELHRMQGEILAGEGDSAAEASFVCALEIASRQNAKSWELRTATSLARLRLGQGRRAEAVDLLAPIYDWFTEGFDTPDLKNAKTLLDDLA